MRPKSSVASANSEASADGGWVRCAIVSPGRKLPHVTNMAVGSSPPGRDGCDTQRYLADPEMIWRISTYDHDMAISGAGERPL